MNTSRLVQLDATDLMRQLQQRDLGALELAQACLDRIAQREPEVCAFAALDADAVLAQARALDAGPIRGALHGLPLGVKDLYDTVDLPTAYGSPIYAGHRPAADASAVALCREAGALVIGKTVTTEFAYFHPGATRNPHNAGHTPGGSSSGSAAAVAAHMVPLALGTQTAGSIIRPAAYCGVVGYKPSWGRISRAGVKSLSETLDVVGGFARSVRDVALLASVLTGDARLARPESDGAPRIGVCHTPDWPQAEADTQRAMAQAVATLAPHAAQLSEVSWPNHWPDLVVLQKSVMAFEMARALAYERVQHREQLSEQLRLLLDDGMAINGAAHAAHMDQTVQARNTVDALFGDCDVLLAPSATGAAPAGLDATGDPLYCRGWTLLGLPCIHLPFATGAHGLPVGLQLVGRHGADAPLLAAAAWCHERLTR